MESIKKNTNKVRGISIPKLFFGEAGLAYYQKLIKGF